MRKPKIKPGALVQIVELSSRDPMKPSVYGLVVEWAASKHGENYWRCIWSNGMSSDVYAADSELRVIAKGREAFR